MCKYQFSSRFFASFVWLHFEHFSSQLNLQATFKSIQLWKHFIFSHFCKRSERSRYLQLDENQMISFKCLLWFLTSSVHLFAQRKQLECLGFGSWVQTFHILPTSEKERSRQSFPFSSINDCVANSACLLRVHCQLHWHPKNKRLHDDSTTVCRLTFFFFSSSSVSPLLPLSCSGKLYVHRMKTQSTGNCFAHHC